MNTVRQTFVTLLLFLVVAACTTLHPFTGSPPTPQELVNEANVTLTAVANVIGQNLQDGTMTKAEAQEYINEVKKYATQVDEAQALIRAGSPLAADRAKLVHGLILNLHKQVAAAARKPT